MQVRMSIIGSGLAMIYKYAYCQVFSRGQESVHEWITECIVKAYELSEETCSIVEMGLAIML